MHVSRRSDSASPNQKGRTWWVVTLAIILAVAAGLRSYHLAARSLWDDEIYTYLSATGAQFRQYTHIPQNVIIQHPPVLTDPAHAAPWWQMLRPDPDDIHPPTFFFLIRAWALVFGWSATALRAFALVASLAAIALMFAAVREWSGTATGLAAAAIMAVAQPQIRMAQEARSYTLVLALALAAAWAVARIERRGITRGRIIALALLCLVLPLIHYFSVFISATLAVYAALRLRGAERRAVLWAICGATAVFAICWSPVLYMQAHGASGKGTTVFIDQEPDHFHQTFLRLGLWCTRALYEPLPNAVSISMIASAIALFPLLLLRRRPDLLIWVLWVPMNVLPTLLIDLTHHAWSLGIERYTLNGTLGIYALLAGIGASFPKRWRLLLPALVILGCLLHVDQAYFTEGRTTWHKWRELAVMYRELARPGDLTVFAAGDTPRYDFMYYLCLGHYAQPFPGEVALIDRPPSTELLKQIRSHSGVLVVGDGIAVEKYFPGAQVKDMRVIVFLGMVARITLPGDSLPPSPAASGSTSRTAPTSQATEFPRR